MKTSHHFPLLLNLTIFAFRLLFAGGDDKRVLVWDVEKSLAGLSQPRVLSFEHASNIFCLGFDSVNRKLISGGNDDLVVCHDFET